TAAGGGAVALADVAEREVAVVLRIVLPGREQRAELEAVPDRGFVPDRVIHAPVELGTVVAAGVAHDGIVIAEGAGERIHRRGGQFVRRLGFAGLDRAPRAFEA